MGQQRLLSFAVVELGSALVDVLQRHISLYLCAASHGAAPTDIATGAVVETVAAQHLNYVLATAG